MTWQQLLLTHTWWKYDPAFPLSQAYHWFNLAEGVAWIAFAGLVLRRFMRHRKSWLEVPYALAFLAFGFTDFVEAYRLTSGLLLLKGINLVVLLYLRAHIIGRHYPDRKIY